MRDVAIDSCSFSLHPHFNDVSSGSCTSRGGGGEVQLGKSGKRCGECLDDALGGENTEGSSAQEVRHPKNGQLAAHCQRISDISSCFRQNEPLLLALITKKLLCVPLIPFASAFPLAGANVFNVKIREPNRISDQISSCLLLHYYIRGCGFTAATPFCT